MWLGGEATGADATDRSQWKWNTTAGMKDMTYNGWMSTEPDNSPLGTDMKLSTNAGEKEWRDEPSHFTGRSCFCEKDVTEP